jgi:hypothetical protein
MQNRLKQPSQRNHLATHIKSRLEYPKGVLLLLKDTHLFGEPIQKALDDLNELTNEIERSGSEGRMKAPLDNM